MIVIYFKQKLSNRQKEFWNNYIANQDCEIQEVNLNINTNISCVILLDRETIPLVSYNSLKYYINCCNESVFIKSQNKILDNMGIILAKDLHNINNIEQIKNKKVIDYDNNSIIYISLKIALKRQIENYHRELSYDMLEIFYSKNYLFARKFDENAKYNNINIYDYISKTTNSSYGINRIDMIYIINLKHRTDRLKSITKELNKVGANTEKIQKIDAIYNKEHGAIGCGMSHIIALSEGKNNNYENILILEDDFILNVSPDNFNLQIDRLYNEKKEWDVVMLGGNLENTEKTEFDFLIKINKARTTSAYIVNKNMFDKLINNFKEACEMMKLAYDKNDNHINIRMKEIKNIHAPNYSIDHIIKHHFAIDMYWQKLQPDSMWYFFTDRLSKQLPSYSDVENRFTQYSV